MRRQTVIVAHRLSIVSSADMIAVIHCRKMVYKVEKATGSIERGDNSGIARRKKLKKKKQLDLQKQASVLERYLKKGKSS
ncbi:hypothetical protein CTI12_AA527760 [Artemisia annua]|uniref:Uncharacterized protein n=1 Tax=Artemisia annua TaxID=35608 RepID=A0A2U1L5T5_ARTAN|nr:hypothetical protein CTI12_AA527760 [Artemisia annua]